MTDTYFFLTIYFLSGTKLALVITSPEKRAQKKILPLIRLSEAGLKNIL